MHTGEGLIMIEFKFNIGDFVSTVFPNTNCAGKITNRSLVPYMGIYYAIENSQAYFRESDLCLVELEKSVSGGLNKDTGKLRVDLVPVSSIRAIAEVLGGACASGKYPARNWEKGISYSRIYANILRHLMAWYDGEDKDKESGLHPLKHALCRLAMLVEYIEKNKEEFDDRPGKRV
jgi:hypothetical protein